MVNYIQASIGHFGGKRIDDTTATTPDNNYVFTKIIALTNTTINTTTGNVTNLDGAVIPAGTEIRGRWTSITLTSGDCIAEMGV